MFMYSKVVKDTDLTTHVEVHISLSITLLNGKVCENDFAQKLSEFRSGYDIVGQGKVCSCAPTFNYVSMPLDGAKSACQFENAVKFLGFAPQRRRENKQFQMKFGI